MLDFDGCRNIREYFPFNVSFLCDEKFKTKYSDMYNIKKNQFSFSSRYNNKKSHDDK